MLHIKKLLCALLTALLLVQPVFAETQTPTEPQPDIVTAVFEIDTLPVDISPAAAPQWLWDLIAAPLYAVENGAFSPVLADSLPEDVTAEFTGNYGIPEDAARGYAFRIFLRADVRREDGSPITAGDWAAAIRDDLQSWTALANAQPILDKKQHPGNQIVSLKAAGFSGIAEAWEAGHAEFYVDMSGFWGLSSGWRAISDRTRMRDFAMPGHLEEAFVSPSYIYRNYLMDGGESSHFQRDFLGICTVPGAAYTPEDLGLIEERDDSFILIFQKPTTLSTVASKLAGLVLPGRLSYGPYRITSAGTELLLEPNPHWWGGPDPRGYDRILCRKIDS